METDASELATNALVLGGRSANSEGPYDMILDGDTGAILYVPAS